MKLFKLAVAAVFAFAFGNAYAFHTGGVADCEGCHTMHNSLDNTAMVTNLNSPYSATQFAAGPYLLQGSDQSSACLNCHRQPDTVPSSYHIMTDLSKGGAPGGNGGTYTTIPVEMTPGGDFAWLQKTYSFIVRGNTVTDYGDTHGHNIVAADYSLAPKPAARNAIGQAPGGTYPVANLYCSSCHDPHGRYRRFADGSIATTGLPIFNSGSYNSSNDPVAGVAAVGVYRLLAGVGYLPKSISSITSAQFVNPSPAAVAPSSYNAYETGVMGGNTQVAYGQNMAEWCANCHPKMLENGYTSGMPGLRHPAGNSAKMGVGYPQSIATNYNAYTSSGIMTNTAPGAYDTLVPFEMGIGSTTADYDTLKTYAVRPSVGNTAGTSTNVFCLSCHRAHASGFPSMTRYFLENEFMTVADASNNAIYSSGGTSNGTVSYGKTQLEQQFAYYGRPATVFGPYARDRCNKCHAKD